MSPYCSSGVIQVSRTCGRPIKLEIATFTPCFFFSQKIHYSLQAGDAYAACMTFAACVHMIQEDAAFRLPRKRRAA